ncbi:hypothetical protein BC831DRAFT_444350 [Entophlyctis helioformis]|nr:hypothetical protein BC831DRAFT_444350 [Entophlyctis helioformis]
MLPVLALLHLALQCLVPAVAAQATTIQVASRPGSPPVIPPFPFSSIIGPVRNASTACPAGSDSNCGSTTSASCSSCNSSLPLLPFSSTASPGNSSNSQQLVYFLARPFIDVAGPTNSSSNVRNNPPWYALPAVQVNEYSSIAGCQAGDPRTVTRVFLFGIERCVNRQLISYTDGAFVTKSCSDDLCRSCSTVASIDNSTAPAQCTQSKYASRSSGLFVRVHSIAALSNQRTNIPSDAESNSNTMRALLIGGIIVAVVIVIVLCAFLIVRFRPKSLRRDEDPKSYGRYTKTLYSTPAQVDLGASHAGGGGGGW